MNNTIIAKVETYIWMLNGLLASYGRYADEAGIDLDDRESEFCIEYYKIMKEERKVRFYSTEEELEQCREIIHMAREKLEQFGGIYIG